MNNFENMCVEYQKTKDKPDKLFSILPTVLSILSPLKGQRVVDLGCGSGFFTEEIAKEGATRVYGIDNCKEMLKLAPVRENIEYLEGDIFEINLPNCDRINAPFVLNYADSKKDLLDLFVNCARAMQEGKLVAVLDDPLKDKSEKIIRHLKKIGAIKSVQGKLTDEARIEIELWVGEKKCGPLYSRYYSRKTVESLLKGAGFSQVVWHKPLISKDGFLKFGKDFWEGYEKICELSYVEARK